MAYTNDIRGTAPVSSASLSGMFKTVAERYGRYRVYRQTVAELSQLSDRELSDLGLSRAAIKGIAYETAYGA